MFAKRTTRALRRQPRVDALGVERVFALEHAQTIDDSVRGTRKDIADQLSRAAGSVVANYIEGCGRRTTKERARFFGYAKGSANECIAWVEVAHRSRLIDDELRGRVIDIADHVAAMLAKWR